MSTYSIYKKPSEILPQDYPFKPNYIKIDGIQTHYIDEGLKSKSVILFLHGVPTWSYTFRNIIIRCAEAGFRVIVPDIPGFGRSDKPMNKEFYTLTNLKGWISEFISTLGLAGIFLFAHDWGVIIGLLAASGSYDSFDGIIACNGMLPVLNQKVPFQLRAWRLFTRFSPWLPVGRIVSLGSGRKLRRAVRRSYDIPFTRSGEKIAIRTLPHIIPFREDDNEAGLITDCWAEMGKWQKPFLTVFSDSDPITRGGDILLQDRIPGAKDQAHWVLKGRHFLQEDAPGELSRIIIGFVNHNT
ncbi:MAG TPA: haloalkane dehalogenase [Bacteroidales bacterium]|nr:haloalkane dehalogenase [Bacteroidales bacterium]HPR74094.1 haloalkane dehalogenase [Bacteroidales bacterium]HRW86703.1 haloalkane dehalogenase [Bacteroidales bacterium]